MQGVMSREQMEAHLVKKYQERLNKVIWGVNANIPIEALKFVTEAMMEAKWSEEQKSAFKEFLFSAGFKLRREGKKNEEIQWIWYFPIEIKLTDALKEVRKAYEESFSKNYNDLLEKAKSEIKAFSEEKWNLTVIKTENPLYRTIFLEELKEWNSENSVTIYPYLTLHEEWLYLSKNNQVYSCLEESNKSFTSSMEMCIEKFIYWLNFEMNLHFRRKTKKMIPEDAKPVNKFVFSLSIANSREFIRVFEHLGFKFSYFPETYESEYTRLGISVPSYVDLYMTLDIPKKVDNLGYGSAINKEYNKFCEVYH